jgi:hypothetical protein
LDAQGSGGNKEKYSGDHVVNEEAMKKYSDKQVILRIGRTKGFTSSQDLMAARTFSFRMFLLNTCPHWLGDLSSGHAITA